MKFAEFITVPVIMWDWLRWFWHALAELKNPIQAIRFANAMHDNLMECLQDEGHFVE